MSAGLTPAVLCAPRRCGLNDVLVQVWESYSYARDTGRRLLVDTRLSGLWDDLDNYLVPIAAGPVPITLRLTDEDVDRLNRATTYPPGRQGRLDFLHREADVRNAAQHRPSRLVRAAVFLPDAWRLPDTPPFRATPGRRLRFLANALVGLRRHDDHCFEPRPEEVVVHHRSGGGPESVQALRLFTFTEPLRAAVREGLARCGPDYDAVHIRNTDLRTDYLPLLTELRQRTAGRRVLVCSDDAAVVRAARDILVDAEVVTATATEDTGGEPLHKIGALRDQAARRRMTTNMFVDLLCLAGSRELTITPTRQGITSGYSRLAHLLQAEPALVAQLLSDPTDSLTAQPPGGPDDRT